LGYLSATNSSNSIVQYLTLDGWQKRASAKPKTLTPHGAKVSC
jgi:hypothetical protein